jgi:hypothetical protein
MKLALCIYTHSSWFDILKIQLDYVNTIFKDLPYDVYVFSDIPYIATTSGGRVSKKRRKSIQRRKIKHASKKYKIMKGGQTNSIQLKYKTILYDDTPAYYSRLTKCIEQVDSEYIILTHEKDILISFDKEAVNKIIDIMKSNNINSIELVNRGDEERGNIVKIPIDNTLSIVKKNTGNYIFNVQPRLWLRTSALDLFSRFPENVYNTSQGDKHAELEEIQSYMRNNQNTYTLSDTDSLKHSTVSSSSKKYLYVNLLTSSKILSFTEEFVKEHNLDGLIQEERKKIFNKYFTNSKREIVIDKLFI